MTKKTILWINEITAHEECLIGGKNLSLYHMRHVTKKNELITIPETVTITVDEFFNFLHYNNIDNTIQNLLGRITENDIDIIRKTSEEITSLILQGSFTQDSLNKIQEKYLTLREKKYSIAVRSSSLDEDGREHSFAGLQNSFLHITNFDDLIKKIKLVYASLYSVNAISYRLSKKISLLKSAMAVCIQQMIRADHGMSGVIFTSEPQNNHPDFISISANYGLGESIVQGISNPDEYIFFKRKNLIIQKNLGSKKTKVIYCHTEEGGTEIIPTTEDERNSFCLSDQQTLTLGYIGQYIEKEFGYPVDIEWAWDGIEKKFYILQVRSITTTKNCQRAKYLSYKITSDIKNKIITTGKAIGKKVVSGKVKIIDSINKIHTIQRGDILVTNITDPDWEPAMKIAAGIVTNLGGRTCHAAIIARELGIPAIVGTNNATQILINDEPITLICCYGDTGYICKGTIDYTIEEKITSHIKPNIQNTDIMLNIGNPNIAFENSLLPAAGVGLTRMEYIINNYIGIHPLAIINYELLPEETKMIINKKIIGYSSAKDFFVSKLTDGLATIASAFYPRPVTIRLSDFKTNEYRNLLGGHEYEICEENPMIGYRGAMRYLSESYQNAFLLEVDAIKKLLYEMNLDNISLLIPFVRTVEEGANVIEFLAQHGIKRDHKLKIYIMCEIPSNVILANEFLSICDGFSIGSNDLTQLTLGIDRDGNKLIQELFNENNEAVKKMIHMAIEAAKKMNKYIAICGQGPSDNKEFAMWLLAKEINAISLVPDSFFQFCEFLQITKKTFAKKENKLYHNK
jgi:pyruvate,water dikinase